MAVVACGALAAALPALAPAALAGVAATTVTPSAVAQAQDRPGGPSGRKGASGAGVRDEDVPPPPAAVRSDDHTWLLLPVAQTGPGVGAIGVSPADARQPGTPVQRWRLLHQGPTHRPGLVTVVRDLLHIPPVDTVQPLAAAGRRVVYAASDATLYEFAAEPIEYLLPYRYTRRSLAKLPDGVSPLNIAITSGRDALVRVRVNTTEALAAIDAMPTATELFAHTRRPNGTGEDSDDRDANSDKGEALGDIDGDNPAADLPTPLRLTLGLPSHKAQAATRSESPAGPTTAPDTAVGTPDTTTDTTPAADPAPALPVDRLLYWRRTGWTRIALPDDWPHQTRAWVFMAERPGTIVVRLLAVEDDQTLVEADRALPDPVGRPGDFEDTIGEPRDEAIDADGSRAGPWRVARITATAPGIGPGIGPGSAPDSAPPSAPDSWTNTIGSPPSWHNLAHVAAVPGQLLLALDDGDANTLRLGALRDGRFFPIGGFGPEDDSTPAGLFDLDAAARLLMGGTGRAYELRPVATSGNLPLLDLSLMGQPGPVVARVRAMDLLSGEVDAEPTPWRIARVRLVEQFASAVILATALIAAVVMMVLYWPGDERSLRAPSVGSPIAGPGRRIGAGAVDLALAVLLAAALTATNPRDMLWHWVGQSPHDTPSLFGPSLAAIGLLVLIGLVGEHRFGRTPGKRLFGLRVVDARDQPPTWRAALIRNATKAVDLIAWFTLLTILIWPESQRLGDAAAGTRVVLAPNPGEGEDLSED